MHRKVITTTHTHSLSINKRGGLLAEHVNQHDIKDNTAHVAT